MPRLAIVALILVIVLSGCAAGPAVDRYPRAALDRPYTLPGSLAAWDTSVIGGYLKDTSNTSIAIPLPNPLAWRSGLTDEWTLLWTPLPLGIQRQFYHGPAHTIGAAIGLGFSWGSGQGFTVMPHAELYERWRVSPAVAIEFSPSYQAALSTAPYAGSTTFRLGPVFQLSPTVTLSPRAYPTIGQPAMVNLAFGSWFSDQYYSGFTLPLGIRTQWSINRQWDFAAEYDHSQIGYQFSFRSDILAIVMSYYW